MVNANSSILCILCLKLLDYNKCSLYICICCLNYLRQLFYREHNLEELLVRKVTEVLIRFKRCQANVSLTDLVV